MKGLKRILKACACGFALACLLIVLLGYNFPPALIVGMAIAGFLVILFKVN